MRLVLASASPARAALLRAAGIEPIIEVSAVQEDAVIAARRAAGTDPGVAEQVLLLARAKAQDVATRLGHPVAGTAAQAPLVLGCDSLLEVDGVARGKPHTPERAREWWRTVSGRSGVLHTGHHLCLGDHRAEAVSSTTVHFAELGPEEVDAYVATGEPLQVAGAFTIDGLGGAFIERIEGDHHGVVGLSLPLLRTLVSRLGIPYPALWTGTIHGATNDG
ncbi:Maf family protein [Serinibacter salmoneus]|uniref:Nucleoside triphosphate pyrophosphatase n=1 Tax=Serinibacter salmoneus TaxID=556530 RepID=A0A2A9D1Y3_9MICO|nr:Maf family protein [Serinibacter salmoneus]PFG20381.1 septum formation protein [Serinibacter salmoneus]